MLKKNLSGRLLAHQFKETVNEPPVQLKEGCRHEKDALVAELEKSLENLRQAIASGEAASDKLAAALSGNDNGN